MSNISITGNEAQFNEDVTFLKNVNIGGVLTLPSQELTLNRLDVPDIRGVPNLQITGVTTFTDDTTFLGVVNFSQALSFPDLEVRDRLRVGTGGTVITADSRLNPGKVGIGSTQPTELLDVGGKAKILDLDLRNLNVSGLSTFVGITTQKSTFFGNQLNISGLSTFSDTVRISGTGNLILDGDGPQSLILRDQNTDGIQISYRTIPDEFTIEKQADGSKFFLADKDIGQVELYNSDVKRLATTGVGITVFGDLIVPDVGIRTSRVGLGTTNPVYITDSLDDTGEGPLRLAVDGSISVTRNIYDSTGSPGINNYFLKRDGTGIKWVPITPEFSEGIFLQNETEDVPSAGVAQSFTTLNFEQRNSFGTGTDNITATAQDPDTPAGLATIFTQDFWGFEGNDLYRMSSVGIGSSFPSVSLDVIGNVQISGGTTTGTLSVTGVSTFVGLSTFSNDVFIEKTLDVDQLNVTGLSTFGGNIDANANLDVDGQTDLDVLNVAELATFENNIDANANLDVAGNTTLGDASGDTLIVNATSTFNANVFMNANLDVDGHTELDDLRVSGVSTFVGLSTFSKDIFIEATTDTNQLNVSGVSTFVGLSTFSGDVFIEATTDTNQLKVSGVSTFVGFSTFSDSVFIDKNLNTNTLNVSGVSTLVGVVTTGNDLFVGGDIYIKNVNPMITFTEDDDNPDYRIIQNGGKLAIQDIQDGTAERFSINRLGRVTVNRDLDVDRNLEVTGISTFSGTVDLDSTVKDRNDSDGTTVAENLSNAITDVDYNSTTGIMIITIANHDFVNGDSIQIPDGTITLSCNYKGVTLNQSYPRSKDPNSGKWLVITKIDDNRFSVDVGDGGLAAGITHNFVSASGGVLHSSGQYVEYDYRLASVGTGVSWRPSGVQTKRTIWVSKSGSDSNSGLLEGDAKATIGAAASIAVETDTIKIRPGLYIENNPIGLRTDVSVTGEDLRLVTVQSKNKNKDVFHVRRGCLIENLNFGGSNVGVSHAGAACVAFPTPAGADSAVTGYTAPGPATEGPSGRWRSPYVRNCTNFMTDSIGLKVDGDNATASTIGGDLKSMVVDSYTQYNENGIGVSLTNNGYAQLVSIFTISCDIGIFASSGAQCDLTNSNSSFGNFGLVAVGLGSTQFTGVVSSTNPAGELIGSTNPEGQDTVVCANVRDIDGIERRPFDGQALFFKIDLDNYIGDVNIAGITTGIDDTGRITEPLQQLRSVNLIATGSDLEGFSAIDPPSVLIRDFDGEVEPKGPQGIIAEAVADVDATGKLVGVDVIAQGRNYLSGQNIVVDIEGNIGLATAVMEPIFFTVASSTENPIGSIGIATVTFNEFVPYELFPGDPFSLQRISRILTSSHSFEYVGAGTDINISTPLQGAIPIKANEIVSRDGAQIPFTSTDQQGNFDIGQGLQINQTTSSITGRDFSRSIQAQVTPLILALR